MVLCEGELFYVIGVSLAATRGGGSGITPTTRSQTKELPVQGKEVSNPEGSEYGFWTMIDKLGFLYIY